jgi:catechol 2,3-dioxygenase-like lactoylglutathione lyase family enzyme
MEDQMSRVQLALNVDDLDAAIAFYSTLFQAEPAKRRPGYANFAIAEPALKLVLIENPGAGGTLNHLGVEVESTDEVVAQTRRFAEAGLQTRVQDGTTCCYALQDKVWVEAEGAGTWEFYTVLADAAPELEGKTLQDVASVPAALLDDQCCATSDPASEGSGDAAASGSACCATPAAAAKAGSAGGGVR